MRFVAKLTQLSGKVIGSLTELTELVRYDMRLYRAHRTLRGISKMTYPIPKYGYEVLNDLTELSGKDKYLKELTEPSVRV